MASIARQNSPQDYQSGCILLAGKTHLHVAVALEAEGVGFARQHSHLTLKRQMAVLPGETYSLSFEGDSNVEMSLSGKKNAAGLVILRAVLRSEEHTSELQ